MADEKKATEKSLNELTKAVKSSNSKLLKAQRETTDLLMTEEQRAAANEANQNRVEGGRKAWETRQAKQLDEAQDASNEEQEQQEESVGFLGKIANFMGMGAKNDASDAEDDSKAKARQQKSIDNLIKIKDGIMGIAQSAKEKIKSGLSGFKKFAFGALAIAALAFLNNPKFNEIKNQILDVIIPALAFLYDNVIKPIGEYLWEKVVTAFQDILAVMKGEKGIYEALMNNKTVAFALGTFVAIKLYPIFKGLFIGVKGIFSAITLIPVLLGKIKAGFLVVKLFFAKTLIPAVLTGLAAIKTFFTATLLPFLASAGAFLLPIIAAVAVIGTLFYALKQGFDDFMFELEATGSVWEAVKTGIVSVISNLFGFPLDLIKSGVSYILEKIGSIFGIDSFIDASKAMDDFSFVDFFKDSLTSMGDYIAGLFDAAINFLKEKGRKILKFVGLDDLSDRVFGTKEEDDAKRIAKEEEKRQLEEQRIALREQKRLEEKEKEAAKIAEAKKREEAMALKVDQSNASNRQKMIARRAETQAAAPAPSIFNAPTTVSAPSTTNVSSTTTTLSNNDRVIDSLSFVT